MLNEARCKKHGECSEQNCAGGIRKAELIEVQTGSYLGEDDIIRIEDDYRRE